MEEDRVLATALGGEDIYDNLQLLHGHCHDEKTALDLKLIREYRLLELIGNNRWANRRHPNKGKKWVKNKYWKSIENRNWVFSETYENEITYTLTNHADTKTIRHVKVRGNKSPYDYVYR